MLSPRAACLFINDGWQLVLSGKLRSSECPTITKDR